MTAHAHPPAAGSSKAINLRVADDVRALIDRAANAQGRSRSEFMVTAARRAAEEALLDQTFFALEPEAFQDFLKRLDETPQPNEALRRTLQAKMPPLSE